MRDKIIWGNGDGAPEKTISCPVEEKDGQFRTIHNTLPLTVAEVCDRLEEQGLRSSGQSDESWQRRVRTVCGEVGFKCAISNLRTESNRQRFTPAELGLPSNFGERSFWTRTDLLHQLHKAQAGYRALMLRVHPDKGGDAETFREVKRLWRNVQNRFKRQGYKLT